MFARCGTDVVALTPERGAVVWRAKVMTKYCCSRIREEPHLRDPK